MWRYSDNLRALYETPTAAKNSVDVASRRERAGSIIDHARKAGRAILTEFEAKQILQAYDIPIVETHIALTADEAVKFAEESPAPEPDELYRDVVAE